MSGFDLGLGLPRWGSAIIAMVLLAGLDLVGALLAQSATHSGSSTARTTCFALGLVAELVLFTVYCRSLTVAELLPVTFGWIAILQVGLLVWGAVSTHIRVTPTQWGAGLAILALEGYLLLSSQP